MESWINIFSLVYPVGSIYETTNNSLPPSILFGMDGEWVQIGTRTIEEKTIYVYERIAKTIELEYQDKYNSLYEEYSKLVDRYNNSTDEAEKEMLQKLIEQYEDRLEELNNIYKDLISK